MADVHCPYCATVLDRPPKRKAKCKHCGEYIVVRTKQKVFKGRHHLTEAEARAADWIKSLRNEGAKPSTYRRHAHELQKRWGKEPEPDDVVQEVFDELRARSPKDWRLVAQEARFRAQRGMDPIPVLKERYRLELLEYAESPVVIGVRIDHGCCEACNELAGRRWTIEEALEEMPLPHEGCTRVQGQGQRPVCICHYLAVTDLSSVLRQYEAGVSRGEPTRTEGESSQTEASRRAPRNAKRPPTLLDRLLALFR